MSKATSLLAARDDDAGVARGDLLGGERDGAQARAADLVDAEGRGAVGNARLDRGLARRVLALRARSSTWPRMTSETSPGWTLARSSAALIATAPSSWAGTPPKAPLNDPTAVRAAETITISVVMSISSTVSKILPCRCGEICSETTSQRVNKQCNSNVNARCFFGFPGLTEGRAG